MTIWSKQPPELPGWYYILWDGAEEPVILHWDGNVWLGPGGLPCVWHRHSSEYGPRIPSAEELASAQPPSHRVTTGQTGNAPDAATTRKADLGRVLDALLECEQLLRRPTSDGLMRDRAEVVLAAVDAARKEET